MPDASHDQPLAPDHLKLRAILENAVDAIITIDERGVVESANPATTALFQYSLSEIVGQNVNLLMPLAFQEDHDRYIRQYIESGNAKVIGFGREVLGQRKDGSMFPIHLAVSEIVFGGRRLFTGIVRDMSDVKAAEKKLAELNSELEDRVRQRTAELHAAQAELVTKEKLATLGEVAGGIAHEIRNPLNAISTSAYYLRHATDVTSEKEKEHLERIGRQVSVIDNVITALADVARLPDPHVSPLSVDEIFAQVLREVTMPATVSVQLQVSDEVGTLMADRNQIPIVFRNLLRNARDAMPDGGLITVTVKPRGDRIAMTVSDTGIGIAEEALSRILEPFYSTKARGMGLGLSICKAIVQRNGGRLLVASQLGQGSHFTVELKPAD